MQMVSGDMSRVYRVMPLLLPSQHDDQTTRQANRSFERICKPGLYFFLEHQTVNHNFNRMLPVCTGLGTFLKVDPDLVIPNKKLTIREGAIRASGWYYSEGGIDASQKSKPLFNLFHNQLGDHLLPISQLQFVKKCECLLIHQ